MRICPKKGSHAIWACARAQMWTWTVVVAVLFWFSGTTRQTLKVRRLPH